MISSIRLGGPLHLAGLVDHDVVVVLLAGELDRGVALAELELVGGLGRPRCAGARRASSSDGGTMKIEQRLGDPLLDHLGALDVDLEDDVAAGGERLADLAARRPVPVAVDLVRLEELAGVAHARRTLARSRKW